MNLSHRLGLLGMVINGVKKSVLSPEETPELLNYLASVGISDLSPENLRQQLDLNVAALEHEFDYYDGSELKVNEVLNQFLLDLGKLTDNADYRPIRDVSILICALGNKGGDFSEDDGVESLIEMAKGILEKYLTLGEGELPDQSDEVYRADSRRLEYLERVLGLVDVFVTSHAGMRAGLEEYAPVDYNYLNPVEVTDWVSGVECSQQEDCSCGCVMDHPLRLLQGIEDYLEGYMDTPDALYFEGVARANNIRLELMTGNEGPVFDSIKAMAKKAYEAVMEAWKTVSEWFSASEDDKNTETVDKADDNKKAIQGMQDKGVAINDAAKRGIQALAEKIDPSGNIKAIVLRLTGPSSAPGVIDSLLGELNKHGVTGKELQEEKKKAEEALAELKKASESTNGNDENKEAVATVRTDVNEKVKNAREAVGNAKKTIRSHNAITKGIRKAIEGITPHIFVTSDANSGGNPEPDNPKPAGKGKKKK